MDVTYKGGSWQALSIRSAFFEDYKRSNSHLKVTITRGTESKEVEINELQDYS